MENWLIWLVVQLAADRNPLPTSVLTFVLVHTYKNQLEGEPLGCRDLIGL